VVLLLFLAWVQPLTVSAQTGNSGRLVAEGSDQVWMGDFPASQSQTVRFRLRNPGPGPVGIRAVSKSCGCADAEMTTNWVTAGAEVGITLRTQPGKLVGSFSKSVYVITTAADPQFRATQLTLAGRGLEVAAATNARAVAASPTAATDAPLVTVMATSPSRTDAAADMGATNALVRVEFFVQEGCAECLLLRRDYLPALAARYGGLLSPVVSDTHERKTFLRLLDTLETGGVTANEPLYLVVNGTSVLAGWSEVRQRGFDVIDRALSDSRATKAVANSEQRAFAIGRTQNAEHRTPNAEGVGEGVLPESKIAVETDSTGEHAAVRLFRRFGWAAVAAAGLADGLNPCAFATIVFLTSLLAAGGRRGGAVLLGGLAFCLASFATYLVIGLGLLSALRRLECLAGVRAAVEWATIAALAILGALSLLDAWRYGRTGDAKSVRLQLPDGVKKRIRRFALARWGGPAVFGTGLVCGAGVTVLESVCTGQMYLPTLVFMSREGGGVRAWGLLLLYNVLFIVPLLAVFILGALGVRSQRLAELTRSHVVPSKLLLAAVFLILSVLLLVRALG
jgi:cytochrome c biogenesis protein CcdA